MTAITRQILLFVLLFTGSAMVCATAQTFDLGQRATSGTTAIATMPDRERAALRPRTCLDEENFEQQVKERRWPSMHLVAKAGWAAKYDVACEMEVAGFANDNREPPPLEQFQPLAQRRSQEYVALYGPACRDAFQARRAGEFAVQIVLALSPACLIAQVRTVVMNPDLGAWEFKDGRRIPKYPGTSADKLPCILDVVTTGSFTVMDAAGDWDMSVIEYTRLARLLEQAITIDARVEGDARQAIGKIDRELLTLRGGPARETYDLVFSCGNKTNSFGTADEYVADDEHYDQEQQRAISGENVDESSTGDDIWRFLRFLLIVAAVALVAGAILGALAGGLGGGLAAGLAAAAAVAGAIVVVSAFTTLWVAGIEETENHLLMQNSSIYLKNKRMMEELRISENRDGFDEIAGKTEDVRQWLLERLQRIVEEDFVEYNAKPYARLSHAAILNLIDDACRLGWSWERVEDTGCHERDQAIVTAAAAVFDLSAVKAAIGSSQGRRIVPFRRLAKVNMLSRGAPGHPPLPLTDFIGNADHLLAALQFWTGDTRQGPDGRASYGSTEEMLWHATSRYRPHALILDLAIHKTGPYEQTYTYEGYERYSGGPGWQLTAGGDSTGYAQGLRMNLGWLGLVGIQFTIYPTGPADDKGVGVPTTLMIGAAAARRATYPNFLRFEGTPELFDAGADPPVASFSNNRCVTGSFACGIRFEIPEPIADCLTPARTQPWSMFLSFMDAASCPELRDGDERSDNDIYLAVWKSSCHARGTNPACEERDWGFVEVAQRSQFPTIQAYEDAFVAANRDRFRSWNQSFGEGDLTFWSITQNREIKFSPMDEDFDADCRACGTFVNHESGARITIRNPAVPGRIFIDLNNEEAPVRNGEDGVILDALF
ncbi:hypothetical protein [Microvirga sp. TS319]|uniref:hypothetical protein n=1 Tax=Microvirga sp. TS319 TaxID=3241165 RepID=UPI00351A2137